MISSHSSEPLPCGPAEQGDHIINWHLQYVSQLYLTGNTQLTQLADLLRAELTKMETDRNFIRDKLPGNHKHLSRLNATMKEMDKLIDPLRDIADRMRFLSRRTTDRVIC